MLIFFFIKNRILRLKPRTYIWYLSQGVILISVLTLHLRGFTKTGGNKFDFLKNKQFFHVFSNPHTVHWVMTSKGSSRVIGTLSKVIPSYWMYLVINHSLSLPGAIIWGISLFMLTLTSLLWLLLSMPRVTFHVTTVLPVLSMSNLNNLHILVHKKALILDNSPLVRVQMLFTLSYDNDHNYMLAKLHVHYAQEWLKTQVPLGDRMIHFSSL